MITGGTSILENPQMEVLGLDRFFCILFLEVPSIVNAGSNDDDGIATGATVLVLLKWLSKHMEIHIILAVPVISAHIYQELKKHTDCTIALEIPTEFFAVGQFYNEFDEVKDNEVISIIEEFKN